METRIIPEIGRYDGGNAVLAAREEQRKKAWIRNVVRCLGITEERAHEHWEVINRHRQMKSSHEAPH